MLPPTLASSMERALVWALAAGPVVVAADRVAVVVVAGEVAAVVPAPAPSH